MIDFACPSCSRPYSVHEENANKRTRCAQCRAPLVIPDVLDLSRGDLQEGAAAPVVGPGAVRTPAAAPPAGALLPSPSSPEPDAYKSAERCSAFLAGTNRVVGTIAGGLCLVGCWFAIEYKSGAGVLLGCLVGAVAFGLSVVASELVHQLVLVFLDHARNNRAVRHHLTRGG
jgi:hypothetical protein